MAHQATDFKADLADALNIAALPKNPADADGLKGEARPVTNSCALPSAPAIGDATASPVPIPTIDGALYLAAEILLPEFWPAGSNHDLWGGGPDGTYQWRNQADGFFAGGASMDTKTNTKDNAGLDGLCMSGATRGRI